MTTFVFKVDEGREDPSPTLSGPSSACQQNAIKWRMAFRWHANECPTLNAGFAAAILSGSGHVLLENPTFCDFSGGGGGSGPGSAHVIS